MSRIFFLLVFFPALLIAENSTFEFDLSNTQLKIVKKKKKIVLTCKPIRIKDSTSFVWINECNNAAYNFLMSENVQQILINKEIEDNPFGDLSYQNANKLGSSMLKKSIRKSFKIKKQ